MCYFAKGEIMNGEHNQRQHTEDVQIGYQKILARLEKGSTDDGIALIEDFLRGNPNHAEAHNDLAVLYYHQGNKLQTLGHYEKAVRISPENCTFRKNLASFYFVEMGWSDDAIFLYTDILKNNPNDTETLSSLGIISRAIGRLKEAKIFFQKLLDLEPWNNETRIALETLNTTAEDQTPNTMETTNPSSPTQISHLDTILAGLRETLTELENSAPEDLHRKSQDLVAEGRIDQAISELERLLGQNPHDALAHNDLGVLYYRQGNSAKSVDHYEFAVANSPRNPLFLKNLADVYYTDAGRTDDAVQIYLDLLRVYPDDVETLSSLAVICCHNERREEARIFLKKILEIEPSNNDARSLLESLGSEDETGFFLHNR